MTLFAIAATRVERPAIIVPSIGMLYVNETQAFCKNSLSSVSATAEAKAVDTVSLGRIRPMIAPHIPSKPIIDAM